MGIGYDRYARHQMDELERLRYVPCEHCHGTGEIIHGKPGEPWMITHLCVQPATATAWNVSRLSR